MPGKPSVPGQYHQNMEENPRKDEDEDRSFLKGGEQTEVNLEPGLEASRHSSLQVPPSSSANLKMKIKNKITLFCDSVPCNLDGGPP